MAGQWPYEGSRLDNIQEVYIQAWETGTVIGVEFGTYMVVKFDKITRPVVVSLLKLERID